MIPDLNFKLKAKLVIKQTVDGVSCQVESFQLIAKHRKDLLERMSTEADFHQILASVCGVEADGYYEAVVDCRMKFIISPNGSGYGDCQVLGKEVKPLLSVVN